MKGRGIPAAVASAGLIALVAIGAHGAPAGKKDEGPFKRGLVGRRAYRLYVPPRPPTESLPLVVALHGCWQTPEDFAQGTRLNEAAERRGFLALYPAQRQGHNPSRCWNWFDPASNRGAPARSPTSWRWSTRSDASARHRRSASSRSGSRP